MLAFSSELLSWLADRFRSRAELELEVIALRHQLAVLRRQRPGRPQLFALDRLLWIWLYRVWPRCLNIMVLVKPATAVQWHRQGFRLCWRWRSRRPFVEVLRCAAQRDMAVDRRAAAGHLAARIGNFPTRRGLRDQTPSCGPAETQVFS